MADCLFCKIIAGEIPSTKIYEDDTVYAFADINPIAPVHYLIIPKTHVASVAEITPEIAPVIGHIYEVAAKIARDAGLDSYRIINNCGEDAGQSVFHLHFHLLGGVKMGWGPETLAITD